jgi:hypothetical protein
MTDLVGLLYRADWSRLSLTAEVNIRRDLDLDRTRDEDDMPPPGKAEGAPPPWQLFRDLSGRRPAGGEWEMATDQLGTETHRSTLLIQPGRRYREQGEDFASGCDGDRSWTAVRKDGDWDVEADDGPESPRPPMLRPSWLLTGYTLEAGEAVTADGREALRVVAVPRPRVRSRRPAGTRPPDRVEVLVDLGLGILLRHEEILDGRTLSVTELTGVRLDPGPVDDDRFVPPGGWDSLRDSDPAAPGGPVSEAGKLVTGLAERGIGALVKSWASRSFEQDTRERPVAEMPPDPEPLPAGGPAVTDQMLHLLHDSPDRWATGITATLHHWQDMGAMLTKVPDSVRRMVFGGYGHLMDAASERAGTLPTAFRVSVDGSGRYRIEQILPAAHSSGGFGNTIVGDGERQWWLDEDERLDEPEWLAHPGGPPPHQIAKLLDASWLLEHRLTGGAETTVGDRRGYRFAVAADAPIEGFPFPVDDVVADAETGVLLRLICHKDSTPVDRYELSDAVVGGDIRIDVPERRPGDPDNEREWMTSLLTRQVTKQARSAFRNIFGGR